MSVTKSNRKVFRWKYGNATVELIPQWALSIKWGNGEPGGLEGATQERALFYSRKEAMAAIASRLGMEIDRKNSLPEGVGALFAEAGLYEDEETEHDP